LKAEIFSWDFVTGIIIFSSIVIMLGIYYTNIYNDISEYETRKDLQMKAISIANLLATSSGEPEFWNSNNVKVIGLYDSGQFNLTKFDEIKKMSYRDVKNILGVGRYEIYIEIQNETGSVLEVNGSNYSFGVPLSNVRNAFSIKRFGLVEVNGEIKKSILKVVLWSREV
jgi:hypothetical protein